MALQLLELKQITELPVARAEVIEVRQFTAECSCCGANQGAAAPKGMEIERRIGSRLEATVAYYRQEQYMSYIRTVAAMRNLHSVTISQGGIDRIMLRAGDKAISEAKAVEQDI